MTQEEIDAMVEKVNAAVKGLVLVKPELKPDDNKKPVVNDKKPTDKTTAPKTGDPASVGMIASFVLSFLIQSKKSKLLFIDRAITFQNFFNQSAFILLAVDH